MMLGMSDTRTTTRWSEGQLRWLQSRAAATGAAVGAVVKAIVEDRIAEEAAIVVDIGRVSGIGGAGAMLSPGHAAALRAGELEVIVEAGSLEPFSEEELVAAGVGLVGSSAAAATVPGGAALVPRPGAAPAPAAPVVSSAGMMLEIAVGRVLAKLPSGVLPPVWRMRGRAVVKRGGAAINGVECREPARLLGPVDVVALRSDVRS